MKQSKKLRVSLLTGQHEGRHSTLTRNEKRNKHRHDDIHRGKTSPAMHYLERVKSSICEVTWLHHSAFTEFDKRSALSIEYAPSTVQPDRQLPALNQPPAPMGRTLNNRSNHVRIHRPRTISEDANIATKQAIAPN